METSTLEAFANCAPELRVQLALLIAQAPLWYAFMGHIRRDVVEPFVGSRTWKWHWTRVARKVWEKDGQSLLGSDEDAFHFACHMVSISCQHAIGGGLCLPAVLGFRGPTVFAMACYGALCEAGWELQDFTVHIFDRIFGGEEGVKRNPAPLIILNVIHHAMGLCMVIPMNIVYHDLPEYHELVFLLQFAAFAAMCMQFYGWSLDMTNPRDLFQMKITVTVAWTIMVWSRLLRFSVLCGTLVLRFYRDGNMRMLAVGGGVMFLMSLFNLLILREATLRVIKFLPMHCTHPGVEDHAVQCHGTLHRKASQHFHSKAEKEWTKLRCVVHVVFNNHHDHHLASE